MEEESMVKPKNLNELASLTGRKKAWGQIKVKRYTDVRQYQGPVSHGNNL